MYQLIINALAKSIIAYLLLMLVARFMGRKAISQMTFFDFAVAIFLGSITASVAIGSNNSSISATLVLVIFGTLAVITGYLHIKSIRFRKVVNSEPVTAIKNGKIVEQNLSKTRFSIDDLMTLLREKNVFNISDVEFAIIENDGQLFVLPKSQKQPLTPSDLNIPTAYKGLTRDLIIDMKI